MPGRSGGIIGGFFNGCLGRIGIISCLLTGGELHVTMTALIALGTAAAVLTRFATWPLSPPTLLFRRLMQPGDERVGLFT